MAPGPETILCLGPLETTRPCSDTLLLAPPVTDFPVLAPAGLLLCFVICANLSPALRAGDGEVTQQVKWRSPCPENNDREEAMGGSVKGWSRDTALPCAVFAATAFPFDLLLSFAEAQRAAQCLPPKWHRACNPLTAQISALQTPCPRSHCQRTHNIWPTPQSNPNKKLAHASLSPCMFCPPCPHSWPPQRSAEVRGHLLCITEMLPLNFNITWHSQTLHQMCPRPTAQVAQVIILWLEISTSSVSWNREALHLEKTLWLHCIPTSSLLGPAQAMCQRYCRV